MPTLQELYNIYEPKLVSAVEQIFELADQEKIGRVDMREVGPMLRQLGVYATEAQIHQFILQLQQSEASLYVNRLDFLAFACDLIAGNKIRGPTMLQLQQAFRLLDQKTLQGDETGFLDVEQMRNYLSSLGEKMTADEVDQFIHFSLDSDNTNQLDWRNYCKAAQDILWGAQ